MAGYNILCLIHESCPSMISSNAFIRFFSCKYARCMKHPHIGMTIIAVTFTAVYCNLISPRYIIIPVNNIAIAMAMQ